MAIHLLGPTSLDGDRALPRRDRIVLTALALDPGASVPAERLADALWGDDPPASWPKIIQGCVLRVRRALGPRAVETTSAGYRLVVTDDEIDVHRFEKLLARARALAAAQEHQRAGAVYRDALALWRGPALADVGNWPAGRDEAARLEELRAAAREGLVESLLHGGDEATAQARALVAEAPLRERRWWLLALALYRDGRQSEALAALRRARRILNEELGLDPGQDLNDLEQAILTHDPKLAGAKAGARPDPRFCPYKGLVRYDVEDRDWFFGRERDTAEALRVLHAVPLLAVSGPSGSGKSSLVRAGIAPALEGGGRAVKMITPGADPEAALLGATTGPRRIRALVVDQLEELFTAGLPLAAVTRFLDLLAERAYGGDCVIVVVRADHLGDLSASAPFARLVETGLRLVSPMTESELREAIEGPARQAGLRVEPGLVDLVLRDVDGEPGALPLLSHALAETWERREADTLTIEGYRASGGVRTAVAQSAERLYESLPARQQAAMRAIVLRLVAPSADGDPVATRVPSHVLEGDAETRRALELLAAARLVTIDDRSVALAHEAVLRAWPRLRDWLEQDVEGRRMLRHLTVAADDWWSRGRPDSELYRGARLQTALEWRGRQRPELTSREGAFLDASAELATAQRREAERRAREQARQNRRLRAALAATAAGLVLALVAGAFAVERGRGQRRTAVAAEIQRLVADSMRLRATRRDVAALLAVEAFRLAPSARTRGALFGVFSGTPGFVGYQRTGDAAGGTPLTSGRILRDGRTLLATGRDGVVVAHDLDRGSTERRLPSPGVTVDGSLVAVSDDERTVARIAWQGTRLGGGRSWLGVFDWPTGVRRFERELHLSAGAVAVSPDGRFVAVSGDRDGSTLVLDGRSGGCTAAAACPLRGVPVVPDLIRPTEQRHTAAVAFRPDGLLLVGSTAGGLTLLDPGSGSLLQRYTGAAPGATDRALVVSRDGRIVVSAGAGSVVRWSADTHRPMWIAALDESRCQALALSQATGEALCGGRLGRVEALDLSSGVTTGRRYDMPRRVSAVVVAPDRELVVLSDEEGLLARWRLDGSGPITRHVPLDLGAAGVPKPFGPDGYSADGRWLSVTGPPTDRLVGTALFARSVIVDVRSGAVVDGLDGQYSPIWTDRPGRLVLWGTATARVTDVQDGRVHDGRGTFLEGGLGTPPPPGQASLAGTRLLAWDQVPGSRSMSWAAWDIGTGEQVGAGTSGVWTGAWVSADGRTMVTTDTRGAAVRDLRTGRRIVSRADVVRAAASPGGIIVGSTPDGRLGFYDPRTLEPSGPFLSETPGVIDQFAFSGDGRLLAVLAGDAVRLIDVADRVQLGEPLPVAGGRPAVAVRRDGAELAVSQDDGIAIWSLRTQDWVSAACGVAGRNLTRAEWNDYLGSLFDYHATCPAA